MPHVTEKNYKYRAAGQTWLIPRLYLEEMPDGTLAISQEEIDRIHRAIANEICGSTSGLSFNQLEFLCDVTETPFYAVAEHIGVHKSTLPKWRRAGVVSNSPTSVFLKKWFWFRLFEEELGNKTVKWKDLGDEWRFLTLAKSHAIGEKLTEPVEELTI